MRTISVVNNKLVISANDNTSYDSTLHKEASANLDNITIDGVVVKAGNSNDGVNITTKDGKVEIIAAIRDGKADLRLYNISRRTATPTDQTGAVVFDQSFIDWYESVKAVPVAQ